MKMENRIFVIARNSREISSNRAILCINQLRTKMLIILMRVELKLFQVWNYNAKEQATFLILD